MNWEHKIENKRKIQQLSTVQDPQKVKVLILTDQKAIYSDFYFITRFVNIVKLDLSYNKLANFSIGFTFRSFKYLRTLFLHYNKFSSIKSVNVVKQCEKLQYLTLFGNPLEETKTRHYFVNQIKTLKLMDDKIIRMEQRNPQVMLKNNGQNKNLPFPIVSIEQSENSTFFLSAVLAQLHFLRQKYLQVNPIIKIQRWFRRKLSKKRQHKKQKSEQQLQYKLQQLINNDNQKYQRPLERLQTQKLAIHISHQEKVLSLLQMNVQFLAFLREKSKKKVFALKQFCEINNLMYEEQSKKLICLRVPQQVQDSSGKSQLQLIIRSSQKYLIRRRGSEISMNLSKKYEILNNLLKKRKNRQPNYFEMQKTQKNMQLAQKINKIQSKYCDQFVLVKQDPNKLYNCMREQFYKSKQLKKLFPFCLEQIMERSAAAVSIQRMWRGYRARKKLTNSYERITRNHAAWMIQRYVRNLGLRKRSILFIQLLDYAKKQCNSNQIIIPTYKMLNLQKTYNQNQNSINFILPDQKLKYFINNQNQILLQKQQKILIPTYFNQYVKFEISQNNSKGNNENILDLLFKGAISIKYLTIPYNQKSITSSRYQPNQTTLMQNKSIKQLLNQNQNLQTKQQKIIKGEQKNTSFVIFQYKSNKQCLNRKFLLALFSYRMVGSTLIKNYRLNLNENSTNLIKNINQRVNQSYFLTKINDQQHQTELISRFQNREKSITMKLKFFVHQEQFITKLKAFYGVKLPINKKDYSLALPLQQLQRKSSIGSNSQRKNMRKQQSVANTAHISKTIISIFPNQDQSQTNFMSYRQKDKAIKSKFRYRYHDQLLKTQQKSLQKCQSLQPISNNEGQSSFSLFDKHNKNNQKNFATQVYLESVTQNLKAKFKDQDKSFGYTSIDEIQLQNKKKKINFLKSTHINKIQQTSRYKKEQLSKLRVKMQDQLQEHNKLMQSSKIQSTLTNARKHNMVKRALSKQLNEIKNFERDFLKRGNSSIRKDLIKFQHDRSSKSPDNQSIYESMKSLDTQILKQHLIKKSKQIFNMRTQIKQFSIDGSEGDHDMSLMIDRDKRSKQFNRRLNEEKKQDNNNIQQFQRAKNLRSNNNSNKKDLKKKRLVHSVFPQQFYPLKQSKKIGFQLPKINHK